MDSIVSSALSEICSQGTNGVSIKDLWPRLHSHLSSAGLHICSGVKTAIWNGLLNIPGLQFKSRNSFFTPQDTSIQSVEHAEELNLRVVAAEHLRDCFLGLYDVKQSDAGISQPQRCVLERLAVARTEGITQSALAKELNIKNNNIFYVVKNLEARGLIVRQSTIVRTKENIAEGENGLKNQTIVNTNLIHLHRYAKHLNSQQRLEITKSDALESLGNINGGTSTSDGYAGGVKEDVLIKDYVPEMKAVCDKLEEADGKVLVVSDIKQALGYRGHLGHRAWRNICNKLKDARFVKKFDGKVDKKVVSCLRLCKKFDPNYVQQPTKCGKGGQNTDQLLELPIEHQIYDIIDAEGPKGITVQEVCKRVGINNKRYHGRFRSMCSSFGMHLQAESHDRSMRYRVWTPGNFSDGPSNVFSGKPEDLDTKRKADQAIELIESSASKVEFRPPDETEYRQKRLELCCSSPGDDGISQMIICVSNPLDLGHAITGKDSDEVRELRSMHTESVCAPSEMPPPALLNSSKCQSFPRYPCLSLTAETAQREQRILERLQEEKFILIAELYRWLESLEKEKRTTMATKTLTRTLSKLQQEGHCRCIQVSVPLMTNCGRNRTTKVVLHKSIQSLPPELLNQIQERLRSFDMQSRGQGLSRLKNDKTVPVLTNINRTPNRNSSDSQAVRSEALRANGFVFAKMVRAKLLHNFLWGYLRSLPDWDDDLCSGRHGYDLKNPHSTCKLLTPDVAIKAMPLELFLQVVGSTQKFEDLVQNCKIGLCLMDLPLQQYTSLMDSQATTRVSSLVNILCRLKLLLKLIRPVTDKHVEDADQIPFYAMELKPYIEEPLSRVSLSLGVSSLDLRPRIRHDFILSNKEAVDIYWKTLEYCYATADKEAAIHAFPGSSVPEVYLYRSWASVRVMTADQRAELLKRVVKDNPDKKISLSDCVEIARDLNLTMEQVLRVSNDKRQSRLNRFKNDLNSNKSFESISSDLISASQRRKKSPKASLSMRVHPEENSECMVDSEEHDIFFQPQDDEQANVAEEFGLVEEDGGENDSYVTHCALSRLKSSRRPRFIWTDTSDKKLVIQYVRWRASLGPRFHRTDWVSLPDLPASPDVCRRRMQMLNQNPIVRKSIMRLCTLLSERYARQHKLNHNISGKIIQECPTSVVLNKELSKDPGVNIDSDLMEHQWDDFEDQNIKIALDEVLRCKQMAKLEVSRSRHADQKEWPDKFSSSRAFDFQEEAELYPSISGGEDTQNKEGRRQRRSRCHRLPGKFLKLLNEGISVSRPAYESLAVANAVELLKLVFLSTSSAPEVPTLLAETLRRYSEHDLFAAFNYLREQRFMVGGNGSQPFVLSQRFLHGVSSSPFPTNTGKRASKFVSWLREREQDLMEDNINLKEDLQCGDIFYLLALVSSEELFISPSLPDEGVGEVEENRGIKRKPDNDAICSDNNVKRLKFSSTKDGEVVSRREKGFPGIKVSVNRVMISKDDALELFPDGNIQRSPSVICTDDNISFPDHEIPIKKSGCSTMQEITSSGSPWEAMTTYGNQLLSTFSAAELTNPLSPELFRTAHSTIHKAGDQGLCLEQISQVLVLHGKEMTEFIIDVLQVFGVAIKVNAYNDTRIVDASFRSKYFLTTLEGRYQALKSVPCMKSSRRSDQISLTLPEESQRADETSNGLDVVHKVTLLNLPEDVSQLSNSLQTCNAVAMHEDFMQLEGTASDGFPERETFECTTAADSHSYRPILPWINGDGTTNPIVYKGLVRHVLGIVMQHPGILEDDVIPRMVVLNPQSCRKLLELMILDNHLIMRKMHQTICSGPPSILVSICGNNFKKQDSICREHLFANPRSGILL